LAGDFSLVGEKLVGKSEWEKKIVRIRIEWI
jgi:hypothetical protein